MNPWTIVAVVRSFGKAYATYQGWSSTKGTYYDSQADVLQLKYKSKEVEAKEDGVKVLKETNKYLSELIAKGGSSGFILWRDLWKLHK